MTAVVDVGNGQTREVLVVATRGGRRVRTRAAGAFTYLEEMTGRGKGRAVKSVKIKTDRLVILTDGKAGSDDKVAPRSKRKRKNGVSIEQVTLDELIERPPVRTVEQRIDALLDGGG